MFRIDTDSAVAVKPVYSPLGTPGYCQDSDPDGGTEIPASWFNVIQEELAGCVVGLGGTLPAEGDTPVDNQFWTLLGPHVQGSLAAETDTGAVSTTWTRALLASASSQASALESAVVASQDSTASGVRSFVGGSVNSTAGGSNSAVVGSAGATLGSYTFVAGSSGGSTAGATGKQDAAVVASYDSDATNDRSACLASYSSTASGAVSSVVAGDACEVAGDRSLVAGALGAIVTGGKSAGLGGQHYELHDNNTVGGGYGASAVTKSSANQNLTWKIDSGSGDASFKGDLSVGVDPDDGTGATFAVDGTTGEITTGLKLPAEANGTCESFAVGTTTINAGDRLNIYRNNTRLGPDTIVLWSFTLLADGGTSQVCQSDWGYGTVGDPAVPRITFVVQNAGAGAYTGDIEVHYLLVNPA